MSLRRFASVARWRRTVYPHRYVCMLAYACVWFGWSGMGSVPPVEIKGDNCDVFFHTDGSTVRSLSRVLCEHARHFMGGACAS